MPGCIITPGWIDHHTHLYPLIPNGIPAESVCFSSGVTTAVDAGSTGCGTYEKNRPVIKLAPGNKGLLKCQLRRLVHAAKSGKRGSEGL